MGLQYCDPLKIIKSMCAASIMKRYNDFIVTVVYIYKTDARKYIKPEGTSDTFITKCSVMMVDVMRVHCVT